MELTIQDLGAIGEMVGGLGVIISLIYLGTQIRFSARATNAQSTREIVCQLNEQIVFDDRLLPWIELWQQGIRTPAVTFQLDHNLKTGFNFYESVWIATKSGAIDREFADQIYKRHMPYTFGAAMTREIWRRLSNEYDPEFVAHINRILEEFPQALSDDEHASLLRELRTYRPEIFFATPAENTVPA